MTQTNPPHATALTVALAVCAINDAPVQSPMDHGHRFTTTVTVTDTELRPAPSIDIPAFSTVVWRNRSSQPLQVEVDAVTCGSCETVLGFQPSDAGARSLTIAPGSVATLCFHAAGRFHYVAHVGSNDLDGSIEVGGTR
jgi:hypothetical protein